LLTFFQKSRVYDENHEMGGKEHWAMKRYLRTVAVVFVVAFFMQVGTSFSAAIWLSTDPGNFDEFGAGYVGANSDPWLNDSYVTGSSRFTMHAYNHLFGGPSTPDNTLYNLSLIFVVHPGETGTVMVDGSLVSGFSALNNTAWPSGSHGAYPPSGNGISALFAPGVDLVEDSKAGHASPNVSNSLGGSWEDFSIEITGYSQVHIDAIAFLADGSIERNPISHDVTYDNPSVAEPGTMILLGISLLSAGAYLKKAKE
jgi:hypothetical protein